ncbi:MAG: hypothetical protein AAF429_14490 [Pseudomonadota bacterium]
MTTTPYYFVPGPVDPNGIYRERRGALDGVVGTLDGVASVVYGIGNSVNGIADIREAWARGESAADDVRLDREERELGLLLDQFKVERGDNRQIYYAFAIGAVALILLMRK